MCSRSPVGVDCNKPLISAWTQQSRQQRDWGARTPTLDGRKTERAAGSGLGGHHNLYKELSLRSTDKAKERLNHTPSKAVLASGFSAPVFFRVSTEVGLLACSSLTEVGLLSIPVWISLIYCLFLSNRSLSLSLLLIPVQQKYDLPIPF